MTHKTSRMLGNELIEEIISYEEQHDVFISKGPLKFQNEMFCPKKLFQKTRSDFQNIRVITIFILFIWRTYVHVLHMNRHDCNL